MKEENKSKGELETENPTIEIIHKTNRIFQKG